MVHDQPAQNRRKLFVCSDQPRSTVAATSQDRHIQGQRALIKACKECCYVCLFYCGPKSASKHQEAEMQQTTLTSAQKVRSCPRLLPHPPPSRHSCLTAGQGTVLVPWYDSRAGGGVQGMRRGKHARLGRRCLPLRRCGDSSSSHARRDLSQLPGSVKRRAELRRSEAPGTDGQVEQEREQEQACRRPHHDGVEEDGMGWSRDARHTVRGTRLGCLRLAAPLL